MPAVSNADMWKTRAYERFHVSNARCRINGEKSERQILNISQGGMLVESREHDSFENGKAFSLVIYLDGESKSFNADVIRVQPRSAVFHFVGLDSSQKKFLEMVLLQGTKES